MKLAVLTSGGDAPGMNAAVRSVVRAAAGLGWDAVGVRHGFQGLIAGDVKTLGRRDVSNIIQNGGTFLGSARSEAFRSQEGREAALTQLRRMGIDAAVVIGGNGTQQGSHALNRMGFPVVGVASTIDNDLVGSEPTLGVDTALNVALEAVDRLKSTASAFRRAFLLEVMGRDCGYLALMTAIAGGAEAVVVPEFDVDPEKLACEIRGAYDRGKPHAIVVVAEGAKHNAAALAEHFRKQDDLGFDVRVTVLGHMQRGGRPTYFDRMLGTQLGAAAVDCVARKQTGVLVGIMNGAVAATPLAEVAGRRKPLDENLLKLAAVMAA